MMKPFVFNTPDILKLELAAEKMLSSLPNIFVPAILSFDNDTIDSSVRKSYQKKVDIISRSYRDNYEQIFVNNEFIKGEKKTSITAYHS